MNVNHLISKALGIILAALILPLLSACIHEKEEPVWSLSAGDRLPSFTVETLDGEIVTSADSYVSSLVIIFFNTSCRDCREELPRLQKEYEANLMLPEPQQSRYICISREEGAADVAAYWTEEGLTMPVAPQTDSKVYSLFASSGIPRVFSARDGVLTSAREGR